MSRFSVRSQHAVTPHAPPGWGGKVSLSRFSSVSHEARTSLDALHGVLNFPLFQCRSSTVHEQTKGAGGPQDPLLCMRCVTSAPLRTKSLLLLFFDFPREGPSRFSHSQRVFTVSIWSLGEVICWVSTACLDKLSLTVEGTAIEVIHGGIAPGLESKLL